MKGCLFIDNHILAVFKDFNISMEDFKENVKHELEKENLKSSYLEPIIPMAKEASGIQIFALSSKAKQRLEKQKEDKTFIATYFAVCVGTPKLKNNIFYVDQTDETVVLDNQTFVHITKTGKLEHIPMLTESAIKVSSNYSVLEENGKISLCKLECGFNHQDEPRFAMYDAKSSIFGDKLYGGDTLAKNTNLALCLVDVKFVHPTTNKNIRLRCYPPKDKKPWSYFNIDKFLRL